MSDALCVLWYGSTEMYVEEYYANAPKSLMMQIQYIQWTPKVEPVPETQSVNRAYSENINWQCRGPFILISFYCFDVYFVYVFIYSLTFDGFCVFYSKWNSLINLLHN